MLNPTDYSLHMHTVGFDGRDTVENMIVMARAIGIKTVGFSNHFIVHPYIKKSPMYVYAERLNYAQIYSDNINATIQKFSEHYAEVRAKRAKYPDMNILCGMEMDLFSYPEWPEMAEYAVRVLKPDYIIGAVHFLDRGKRGVLNVHDIDYWSVESSDKLLVEYYKNVENLAVSYWHSLPFKINFLAHFNLPRKVGLVDTLAEQKLINSLAKNNVAIELNSSLMTNKKYNLDGAESADILQTIAKSNIPVVVSDDAHKIQGIGAGTNTVLTYAKNMGIKNICLSAADLTKFIGVKSK